MLIIRANVTTIYIFHLLQKKLTRTRRSICTAFLIFASTNVVHADVNALVFPQIIASHDKGGDYTADDVQPSVDIFLGANWSSFRILTEYFWTEEENHFERFQIGLNFYEDSNIWIGRYHTPYGYWHTQYHHGNYLQTSITRPSMDEFGGDGGIIPSHIYGALFESTIKFGNKKVDYSLAFGLGSQIQVAGTGHNSAQGGPSLHDVDVFDLERDEHDDIGALRIAYFPDEFADDQYGFFIVNGMLPIEGLLHDEVKFQSTGLFSNTQWYKTRLIASLYHIESEFRGGTATLESGSFTSAYLQLEYQNNEQWNFFGRIEDTHNGENDIYLETLSGFIPQRQMIGVRYDVWKNHALKFEWNRNHHELEVEDLLLIGWSSAFP